MQEVTIRIQSTGQLCSCGKYQGWTPSIATLSMALGEHPSFPTSPGNCTPLAEGILLISSSPAPDLAQDKFLRDLELTPVGNWRNTVNAQAPVLHSLALQYCARSLISALSFPHCEVTWDNEAESRPAMLAQQRDASKPLWPGWVHWQGSAKGSCCWS